MATMQVQSPLLIDLTPDLATEKWKLEVEARKNKRISPRHWFKTKHDEPTSPPGQQLHECLACTSELPDKQLIAVQCSGNHKYCKPCFEQLVQHGCQNEGSFPPRCCQANISRDLIRAHATREARKRYDALNAATSISPENRWYCPNPRCAKVINFQLAKTTSRGLRCPCCSRYICVLCRQEAHRAASQCTNEALRETMLTSQRLGWRACYRCKEMVELRDGCRHVRCRCGAQFCYSCGVKWGRCANSYQCVQRHSHGRARGPDTEQVPEMYTYGGDEAEVWSATDQGTDAAPAFDNGGVPDDEAFNMAISESLLEFEAAQRRRQEAELRVVRQAIRIMDRQRRDYLLQELE